MADELSTGNVILLFDGHHSHINLSLAKEANDRGVHLVLLPPNTTHALQPLDVGVFAPMKTQWQRILKQYKLESRAERLDKAVFSEMLQRMYRLA